MYVPIILFNMFNSFPIIPLGTYKETKPVCVEQGVTIFCKYLNKLNADPAQQ